MGDEDDETDILGDFDLENLLTRRDRTQASYSLSSNDNYSLPPSDWILENASPLFNVKSVLTSDQVIYDNPCSYTSAECLEVNSNIWTEKERTLLERGLELFGKSHTRLSQYIGTKNPAQVKSYLKTYPSVSLASGSSITSLNNIDENELDTVEVVVSSKDNPSIAPPSPSYSISTLSDDFLDSLGSDTDSYMGSTTTAASESDRSIQQEFSMQQLYQKPNKVRQAKYPPLKPKKHFVKKKTKIPLLPDNEHSDDSVDYDNTNIIFKPRKLSKYHLMVQSGDQVLPTGEQVVRIKKEEMKSDTDVDVLEFGNEDSTQIPSTNSKLVDVDSFNPNRGIKISRVVQPEQNIWRNNFNPELLEDTNEEIEVDVVDDLMNGNTLAINAITSCIPIPDEDSDSKKSKKHCRRSRTKKRASIITKYQKSRKKPKVVSGCQSSSNRRNVKSVNNSNTVSISMLSTNVYLKTNSLSDECGNRIENNTPEDYICVDDFQPDSKCTESATNSKSILKKTMLFKESDFSLKKHILLHVDDLLANYNFSNVQLLDHNTQMMRISQLRPVNTPPEDKVNSKLISIEEIDYHRDFFLHNDAFFVNRFLRIRNYILREWSCKKPKYINKTAICSGLKHCGTMVLIARIHSYLEHKRLINS